MILYTILILYALAQNRHHTLICFQDVCIYVWIRGGPQKPALAPRPLKIYAFWRYSPVLLWQLGPSQIPTDPLPRLRHHLVWHQARCFLSMRHPVAYNYGTWAWKPQLQFYITICYYTDLTIVFCLLMLKHCPSYNSKQNTGIILREGLWASLY
jgi:hypothetical protein